uniref:Protein kinase domain-containing protein n=1 Tax=Timspurckia oligopyrenoides TaxID=708627 RepID=A0A7S1ETE3_9RHOD|mmetsp:Transcript_724/g.1306  ORF Transcript_724/g.1306 Transcript_724/m.1306 type:complete len:317 (+) Transcript_724:3-953(+)
MNFGKAKSLDSNSTLSLQRRALIREGIALTGKISEGGQAQVYRAFDCTTGSPYAVKIISKVGREQDSARREMVRLNAQREVDVLKSIDHPNILKFSRVIEDDENCYLVTEFIKGLDLFEAGVRKKFSEREVLLLSRTLFDGLAYLHSLGVAHRDVKLENIVLMGSDKPEDVKLIDFGLAHSFNFDDNSICTDFPGTRQYKAPEIVLSQPYDPKPVDIWALGVVMYILCCRDFPFNGSDTASVSHEILTKKLSFKGERWKNISSATKKFIEKLLSRNPLERPTAEAAVLETSSILELGPPSTSLKRHPSLFSKFSGN